MQPKYIPHFITKTILPVFLAFALCGCTCSRSLSKIDDSDIDRYEITIPGISRDYDLLFITNTHVVISDESADDEIQNYSEERLALFTNDSGLVASGLFTAWIEYADQTEPDALLLGGDIIDSPSAANIEFLKSSLESLRVPYLYTLGNHDWTYPWDYMTESGQEEYLPLLAPYMESNTAIHTLELDDFIIVAVDNSNNQIHPDALEEYRRILSYKKPVILLLHVPFYTESLLAKTSEVWSNGGVLGGGIHGGIYPNNTSTEFLSLTTAADSPVAAVFAGHVHLPDASSIDGAKEIPQIVGDAGYKGRGTLIHISAE